jgi:glycosyltransferase involved in cell wall biosynthesis
MKKICIIVSSPITLEVFLLPQIDAISKLYDLTVVVKTDNLKLLEVLGIDARLVVVPIERPIRPIKDLFALWTLLRLFREQRFELIHSITPKAGLLSMTAGFLARVPIRIHTFTGQVWCIKGGAMRFLLKAADIVTAFFATSILVDSASQRDFIVAEKVLPARKASVLANGSISGVDLNRFRPNENWRKKIRERWGIPMTSFVVLYMSRLTRDKGALLMASAFAIYARENKDVRLLVVGPDEQSLIPLIKTICVECIERIEFVDYVRVPEEYMAAADLFCLPSYREGFGSSLIDAAASGIPAIASRIYGSSDAVVDGVTGLLFETGNTVACVDAMRLLSENSELRESMAHRARKRAIEFFSQELLTSAIIAFYDARLNIPSKKDHQVP